MPTRFPPNLLVGTSSWSSTYWCGSFYPDQIEPGEMIRAYSSKLPTVEIDSTWYRMPSPNMVEAWKLKTPDGFILSAKVPKDRTGQMKAWIPPIKHLLGKGIPVYVYFDNHYAGYAPGSVEIFEKLFNEDLQA